MDGRRGTGLGRRSRLLSVPKRPLDNPIHHHCQHCRRLVMGYYYQREHGCNLPHGVSRRHRHLRDPDSNDDDPGAQKEEKHPKNEDSDVEAASGLAAPFCTVC